MKRKVIICTSWPYAYAVPHLGNFIQLMAGGVLKRYYNHTGDYAIHISGSDTWGARMEYEAAKRGITPKELVKEIHAKLKELIKAYNVEFTNYSWTQSKFHQKFVQGVYLKAYRNGYIITKTEKKPYCNTCKMFLADRFITGTCPYCGSPDAKGNQCDACGRLLEPEELINPKCAQCGGSNIVFKETKHWYLRLDKFARKLKAYADSHPEWNDITKEYTYRWLEKGLEPRPLTRDIKWGIKAPFPGSKGKTIYVWMDAVLGYVSATIEWARKIKKPDEWKKFWKGPCKQVYVQGKDNIPFHTIVFPSILFSTKEKYNLPDQFSSTFFLNWEGGLKFSKSRNIGLWADEALKILPNPDVWTFYLMLNRPEKRDREFSWKELEKTVNSSLVGNIGNLFNRCVTFIHRYYNGILPKGELKKEVKERIEDAFIKSSQIYEAGGISDAIKEVLKLSAYGNEFFQLNEPWRDEKKRPDVLYSTYQLLQAVAIMLEPVTPVAAKKMWQILGLKGISTAQWKFREVRKAKLNKPSLLFHKIMSEDLKKKAEPKKDFVKFSDFSKIRLVTGRVISAEPVGNKLYKLKVKADRMRTIMAGLRNYYSAKELIGKEVIVVANLEPKKLAGELSEGMLLAAESGKLVSLLRPDKEMPEGSEIH